MMRMRTLNTMLEIERHRSMFRSPAWQPAQPFTPLPTLPLASRRPSSYLHFAGLMQRPPDALHQTTGVVLGIRRLTVQTHCDRGILARQVKVHRSVAER